MSRGDSHKGVSNLARRMTPYAGFKCTKEQYENSFNRLRSLGLVNLSNVASRNKNKILVFEKLSLVDISSDPVVLDEFPKKIKFSEHESNRI